MPALLTPRAQRCATLDAPPQRHLRRRRSSSPSHCLRQPSSASGRMPRESLDAPNDLPKQALCQGALGQLEHEVPSMPNEEHSQLKRHSPPREPRAGLQDPQGTPWSPGQSAAPRTSPGPGSASALTLLPRPGHRQRADEQRSGGQNRRPQSTWRSFRWTSRHFWRSRI